MKNTYKLTQIFIPVILMIFLSVTISVNAQEADSVITDKKEKAKTGWKIQPLPFVAYDADLGLQYGIIFGLQDFGDGSTYPEYKHMFQAEVSRFTRGSGVNQLFYDSKYLIPKNIRLTVDISYLTELALNFYGFNGYEAVYNHNFENEDSEDYISRVYYRMQRQFFRFVTDFQGRIIPSQEDKFRWLAGVSIFNFKTATVDIEKLNKKRSDDDQLPDTALLYDNYVDFGFIPENEKDGGQLNFFKLGLIYDTRDNEAAPTKGLWEEIIIMTAPKFFFNKDFSLTKLVVTHRHYFSFFKKNLTFAYRLSYQGTIGGYSPFFFQTYQINSFSTATKFDGLGGSKTLRGIKRNRIVGDGFAYGNFEVRWKFARTMIFKQNFSFTLLGFTDMGQTVHDIKVNRELLPPDQNPNDYFDQDNDSMHFGYGAGLRIAWSENFIIAIDYGFANDRRDGTSGLYIGIGNLF